LLASGLIAGFGPNAMFVFIGVAHLLLLGFSLLRMRARPTLSKRTDYVYVPRTSFLIGKLLGGGRDLDASGRNTPD
jgi:hypothetical protein